MAFKTTLITGGTGKTGSKLAQLLHNANRPVLIASRSGKAPEPLQGVHFDWFNPDTYANPFAADADIDRLYLIGPQVSESLQFVKPFLDLAVQKGVKRIVHLSSMNLEVIEYIESLSVEYAVLHSTWFQDNFASFRSIVTDDAIYTATGDGKIPFVHTSDIAQAAFEALTVDKIEKPKFGVVGPDLWTHDQIAELLTEILGRKITHKRQTEEERRSFYTSFGMDALFAAQLSMLEIGCIEGSEENLFHAEDTVFGKHRLPDYFRENKELWVKK